MKKIIKKKIDEMTEEEIMQVMAGFCFENYSCKKCPFIDKNNSKCLDGFLDWKKEYLDNKDREFEVEVEE